MKPSTYDITFCVSKCDNKCDRHYNQYEFEPKRYYSMANFDCEKKGQVKQIILKRNLGG